VAETIELCGEILELWKLLCVPRKILPHSHFLPWHEKRKISREKRLLQCESN